MNAVTFYNEVPEGDDIDLRLQVDKNLRTGEAHFRRYFNIPTSLERDLLVIASTVFAVDNAAKRGLREEITRDFQLTIPVVNYHALENQRIALERILHFLSHDNWNITYKPMHGTQEPYERRKGGYGKTLLFSGGLDSFAAAVDLLDEYSTSGVQLTSHVTGNPGLLPLIYSSRSFSPCP